MRRQNLVKSVYPYPLRSEKKNQGNCQNTLLAEVKPEAEGVQQKPELACCVFATEILSISTKIVGIDNAEDPTIFQERNIGKPQHCYCQNEIAGFQGRIITFALRTKNICRRD